MPGLPLSHASCDESKKLKIKKGGKFVIMSRNNNYQIQSCDHYHESYFLLSKSENNDGNFSNIIHQELEINSVRYLPVESG